MHNALKTTLAVSWLSFAALAASAETLIVGLDISTSNPLVNDPSFAEEIGAQARKQIESMQIGDRVIVETFGLHGIAVGQKLELQISKKHRPKKVAAFVSQLVAAIPRMVENGNLKPHNATNILSFLELRTEREGCRDTAFFIATDGFESSDAVTTTNRLPTPHAAYLQGCQVTLTGIGGGTQQTTAARQLRETWLDYLRQAGADPIVVVRG